MQAIKEDQAVVVAEGPIQMVVQIYLEDQPQNLQIMPQELSRLLNQWVRVHRITTMARLEMVSSNLKIVIS
jgi:DNA-directed RNA polymerase sigma subunit (sigma70/sigma32)